MNTSTPIPTLSPEIQHQLHHIDDDLQPNILAASIVCLTAAYIAVLLRVISRRFQKEPLLTDDICVFLGLFFSSTFVATLLYDMHNGLGRHAVLIKHPVIFAKVLLASEILYNPAMAATKVSILFLYRRIFPSHGFHKILLFVGIFVLCYSITGILVNLFECLPIQGDWDPNITPRCVNLSVDYNVLCSINAVTDVVILCLPMPILFKLHVTLQKKIQVVGMFLLGGFVCVVSIIRVFYVGRVAYVDGSYADTKGAIWSIVETCLAVVSACLPTLRPLYSRFIHRDPDPKQFDPRNIPHGFLAKDPPTKSKCMKLSTFLPSGSEDLYNGDTDSPTQLAAPEGV